MFPAQAYPPTFSRASSATSADDYPAPYRRRSSDYSYTSANSDSTAPSSIASSSSSPCALVDEWASLEQHMGAFVHGLLKQQREADTALAAWRVRCETLEDEVARLAVLLDKAEKERDEARGEGREEKKGGMVTEMVQTNPVSPSAPPTARTRCNAASSRPIINPEMPMSKQAVPPCNAAYLKGHCDVLRCRYEHRYQLTPEQLDEMRRGAKHHVCNAIKHGLPCPDGEDCIFGHFCPRGPSCGRERCGFNDEQHRVPVGSRPVLRHR